jgi:2'-5' RNA ligase
MTDDELVQALESRELPTEVFTHAEHVRVAWCYVRRHPILIALTRFRTTLQRFAAGKGKPERYHETITIAYMLLIAERLASSRELTWDEFAARNTDLLQWQPSVLAQLYSEEALASARAREMFVLPDLSR